MIGQLYLFESTGTDPYRNLAIEECLLARAVDCAILYLWQNENTVVIGKNQNPWKECRTALLKEEGGHLARRLSGGGAVFHDLGNLNFTILLPQADYDLDRQLAVIQQAVESLGIPAERSGRNDILAEGRKFSGNAFCKNGRQAYHHGTLLIHADLEKLGRYLSPSKLKLQAKGVDSVRSRVANLCQWRPELTVPQVKEALKTAFSQVYGLPLQELPALDEEKVEALTRRNRSWEWNYGRRIPFSCTLEGRFPWGGVELSLRAEGGRIAEAKVYTDAMETRWTVPLEQALTGCLFERQAMQNAVPELMYREELRSLMEELE